MKSHPRSTLRDISNILNPASPSKRKNLTALQSTTPTAEKRSVRFTLDQKPVMRSQIRRQDQFSADESNDEENVIASDVGSKNKATRKEKFLFYVPDEMLESSESSSGTSSAPVILLSPAKLPSSPPQLVLRSPELPTTSHSAPVSVQATPLATPRSTMVGEKNSYLSQINSLKKIGRQLSEKLENISVVSPFKSSTSTTSVHNAWSNQQATNPLANFSEVFLDDLAGKIRALKNYDDFKLKPTYSKNIILNAEILQNLPVNSQFREPAMLKLLLADANERIANEDHAIDIEVDLNDPAFSKFVSSAADGAFIKPWDRDSSDVKAELRSYVASVKPTFARDFENSNYFVKDENGALRKLNTIDEFIDLMKSESNPDLAMVISNIASQNLGNFTKNALFLRQDSSGISQSILKRRNGTPIMPLAIAKASYVFSKNKNGSFTIDYTWASSKEINGAKEIRAKEMIGEFNSVPMKNASLEIKLKVNVEPDGQWTILNPYINAKGWG